MLKGIFNVNHLILIRKLFKLRSPNTLFNFQFCPFGIIEKNINVRADIRRIDIRLSSQNREFFLKYLLPRVCGRHIGGLSLERDSLRGGRLDWWNSGRSKFWLQN